MAKKKNKKKIFVLDTSVILHDHNSLNCFEENDVAIPITVLEELDNFKRGNDTKNYEAREFIRILDRLSKAYTLQDWIPINGEGKGKFKIVMENEDLNDDAVSIFGNKNDHKILNSAKKTGRVVVVDEGHQNFGVTAEIAARISEKAFYYLDAPVIRMGAMDVPVPFSPVLEDLTVPTAEKVASNARKIIAGELLHEL